MTNSDRKSLVKTYFTQETIKSKLDSFFNNDVTKIAKFKSTMEMLCGDPKMSKHNPLSILNCGIKSAEIGLSPLKEMGQVYFVPYQGNLQLQIGYKGWLALLERAGKVVKAHRIYKCDDFEMVIDGFEERPLYKPKYHLHKESDREWFDKKFQGVLVSVKDMNTGTIHCKFVNKDKLDQMMNTSPSVKGGRQSPWDEWFSEMFTAKAIKYVISKMPMEERIAVAVSMDNELDKQNKDDGKRQSVFAQSLEEQPIDVESQELPEEQQPENENQEVQNDDSL